jgi:hypothetical protein
MQLASHDPTTRAAGQHERTTVRRLRMRTLVALGVLAVATALLGRAFGLRSALFLASEIALLVGIFVILRFVLPLVERHDRGATGEEQVGGLLDELAGEGWHVIHDASLGRGNVDHILLGPVGVFTVETKSHPGPIKVARVHGATLAQAQAQRKAIERIVGIPVEPLIVFSRAWVDKPLARRKGVRVTTARMLAGYLERRPQTLTQEQVELARTAVAVALGERRRQALGASRQTPRGSHRWRAAKTRLFHQR